MTSSKLNLPANKTRPPDRPDAACKDADPELFFPVGSTSPAAKAQTRKAKKICKGCPQESDCLIWALDNREKYGIWGGLTEDERTKILRQRKRSREDEAKRANAA